MATKPNIPDFPNLPDIGNMIAQACELIANIRGIPYDFNGTLSLENKFTILFKTVQEMFTAQDALVKSYKELYDFINTYFSKLDVQEEVNKKIQSMADDGSLLTLIAPTIASNTSDWLHANITNPSNPPIDKSLTVENAAADAKVTGKKFDEIEENIVDLDDYIKKPTNIFNTKSYVGALINGNLDGSFTNWQTTEFIKVESNTQYLLSVDGEPLIPSAAAYYDIDKKYLSVPSFNGAGAITVPTNAKYLRLSFDSDKNVTIGTSKLQLEKGYYITPYVPYNVTVARIKNLKSVVPNVYQTDTLIGNRNGTVGYYVKGNLDGNGVLTSLDYIVDGYSRVSLKRPITANYDIYDFLDKDRNVINYVFYSNNATEFNDVLDVPENAVYLVLSGLSDPKNVDAKGIVNTPKENKRNKITYEIVKNGYYHANGSFVDTTDAKTYIFNVKGIDLTYVKVQGNAYIQAVTPLNDSKERIENVYYHNTQYIYQDSAVTEYAYPTNDVAYLAVCCYNLQIDSINVNVVSNEFVVDLYNNFTDLKTTSKTNNFWRGKKIVWFGTSIPAGGLYGLDNANTYPNRLGKILGATVYNEAVGSSSLVGKRKSLISETNPYGVNPNFEVASRSMCTTEREKEWIINNFNNNAVFTSNVPTELSESDKQFIKSCSYETKLDKYLTAKTLPNLFVFDHGHNDLITAEAQEIENTYNPNAMDLYTFRGCMDFLIKRILAFNPHARIVIIGEYENDLYPAISKYQNDVAVKYNYPICKQWEIYGWTQNTITTRHEWKNGYFVESSTDHTLTILNAWLPDKVHPSADLSGKADEYMADHLAAWISSNVRV